MIALQLAAIVALLLCLAWPRIKDAETKIRLAPPPGALPPPPLGDRAPTPLFDQASSGAVAEELHFTTLRPGR